MIQIGYLVLSWMPWELAKATSHGTLESAMSMFGHIIDCKNPRPTTTMVMLVQDNGVTAVLERWSLEKGRETIAPPELPISYPRMLPSPPITTDINITVSMDAESLFHALERINRELGEG